MGKPGGQRTNIGTILAVCLILFGGAIVGCARREAIERYNQAVKLVETKRYAEAMTELETALRLRPDFPEAHNTLGYVLNQNARYDEAAEHFKQAAENSKFKQRPLAYLNLGAAYSNAEHYSEAETAILSSIELEPTAQAYYALTRVRLLQEKTEEALDALEQSLALESNRIYEADRDPILDSLRDNPRYQTLVTRYWR